MIYQYAEGLRLFLAGFTYMGKCRIVVSIPFALSLFPLFLGKFVGKLNDFDIINKPSAYSHFHIVPLLFICISFSNILVLFISLLFFCWSSYFFVPARRSFLSSCSFSFLCQVEHPFCQCKYLVPFISVLFSLWSVCSWYAVLMNAESTHAIWSLWAYS